MTIIPSWIFLALCVAIGALIFIANVTLDERKPTTLPLWAMAAAIFLAGTAVGLAVAGAHGDRALSEARARCPAEAQPPARPSPQELREIDQSRMLWDIKNALRDMQHDCRGEK